MDINKQFPLIPNGSITIFDETVESNFETTGLTSVDLINNLDSRGVLSLHLNEKTETLLNDIPKAFSEHIRPKPTKIDIPRSLGAILTGLVSLDEQLLGGIPLGQITEIVGASGTGKSHLLLSIALQCQKLSEGGKPGTCIYVSTESPLETRRLLDFDTAHSSLSPNFTDNISYFYCHDMENQDHVIFTQLSAKLEKDAMGGRNTRAILIDSIGHHLRVSNESYNNLLYLRDHLAEQDDSLTDYIDSYSVNSRSRSSNLLRDYFKGHPTFRARTSKLLYLYDLYRHLAELAKHFNVAIILSNQVSDVIDDPASGSGLSEDSDPLNFSFQVGTYSGRNPHSSFYAGNLSYMPTDYSYENYIPTSSKKRRLDLSHTGAAHLGAHARNEELDCEHGRLGFKNNIIPALGYTWSKLVTQRIYLWKEYEVSEKHCPSNTCTSPGENTNKFKPHGKSSTDSNTVSSKPRRYARVISSKICTGFVEATEFIISDSGLLERARDMY